MADTVPPPRKVVLCADGTSNARTSQFRTNVWKIYDALDLSSNDSQIAFYHDGVGTDALAPIKYLGAIFGYGVANNVRDIYTWLCRNYRDGDEIYIFGFSRGAFTARMLASLIAAKGVAPSQDEHALNAWAASAFRSFRRESNWRQYGWIRKPFVATWRALRDLASSPVTAPTLAPTIAFLGCWDTVAAYGGPIVEMVRGWDQYVFPLSFADYTLPAKVACARHALALDEERESFLPLLWDEIVRDGEGNVTRDDRIKQVWFPGVHSDVGGGYPDQQLSDVPLLWMIAEAKSATSHPLVFHAAAVDAITRNASALGPRHDSRSGVGMAYRYQPRRIDAYTQASRGNPSRDPAIGKNAILADAIVHRSVLARREDSLDGYAPITLPVSFVGEDGGRHRLDPKDQADIWLLTRGRRRWQFLMLAAAALMALSPVVASGFDALTAGGGWTAPARWLLLRVRDGLDAASTVLHPVVRGVFGAIPGVPGWVGDVYADCGGYLVVGGLLLWLLIRLGSRYAARIERAAQAMWATSPTDQAARPARVTGWNRLMWPVRRSLRWRIVPGVFGVSYWIVAAWCLLAVTGRIWVGIDQRDPAGCTSARDAAFATAEPCHSLRAYVHKGWPYILRLDVEQPWVDGTEASSTRTTPMGFGGGESIAQQWAGGSWRSVSRAVFVHALFGPALRQDVTANWFAPIVAVRSPDGSVHTVTLAMERMGHEDRTIFAARFTAPVSGSAYLLVNDAIGPRHRFYGNNCGTAAVRLYDARGDVLVQDGPVAQPPACRQRDNAVSRPAG